MQRQINCILGPDSACDEIGLKAKRIGPLVLSNHCPRPMCDECTKKAVRMVSFDRFPHTSSDVCCVQVVARMQNKFPKEWYRIQQRLTRGWMSRRQNFIYFVRNIYIRQIKLSLNLLVPPPSSLFLWNIIILWSEEMSDECYQAAHLYGGEDRVIRWHLSQQYVVLCSLIEEHSRDVTYLPWWQCNAWSVYI